MTAWCWMWLSHAAVWRDRATRSLPAFLYFVVISRQLRGLRVHVRAACSAQNEDDSCHVLQQLRDRATSHCKSNAWHPLNSIAADANPIRWGCDIISNQYQSTSRSYNVRETQKVTNKPFDGPTVHASNEHNSSIMALGIALKSSDVIYSYLKCV